jgi:DNA anti-recombination protein RmuC
MATNPRQSERGPSNHINQETRKAGEQVAETVRTLRDAAERTNRVGAETLQRNSEQAKEIWQEANEAASRMTQRSIERFSKMFGLGGETAREALQQSSGKASSAELQCLIRIVFLGLARLRTTQCLVRYSSLF